MKEVFAPSLGRKVKLGACRVRDPHHPRLRLSNYLDKARLPPSPATADFDQKALAVLTDIEGNDNYGDCVEAEEAHYLAGITAYAGAMVSYTPAQVLAMYTALTNFNPSDPSTDQGTDPIACLNYFVQNSYLDGSKNIGWASVDMTKPEEVKFAISQCGNLKIWLSLPDAWTQSMPSSNGFVWDVGAPDPNNGHCIGSGAYNSSAIVGPNCDGIQIRTWGLIGTLTWAAAAALCVPGAGGGAAVRLTEDWVIDKQTGLTVPGLALGDLVADCNAAFGSAIPQVAPTPTPPQPPPSPKAPPTWQDVLAALGPLSTGFPFVERKPFLDALEKTLSPLWPSS